MSLDSYVTVEVRGQSRTPTAKGFGKTALVAYHTHNTDVYREYTDESELEEDGFDTEEPAYLMAHAVFAQNPRPELVLVARGPAATCRRTIKVTSSTQGAVVSVDIRAPDGAWQTLSYTIGAAETTTTVAVALELLVEAVTGITSTSATDTVTVNTDSAGKVFDLRNPVNCEIKETTADPGYASALNALKVATEDFYFLCTEVNSSAVVTATAAWAESNKRVYFWQTSDTIEKGGSSVLGPAQKALGYEYSLSFFVKDTSEYATCAAAGFAGARDPGSYTLALKTLKGVSPVSLTSTEQTNLVTGGYNWYATIATNLNGVTGPNNGGLTTGGNLYLDITHGRDWWVARTQERIVGVLASLDKLSYEDLDILALVAELKAQNEVAIRNKLFSRDPDKAPTALALPVTDQSDSDRNARYFPGLRATAYYAGAVQKTKVVATFI
jgi:hypothetical protein